MFCPVGQQFQLCVLVFTGALGSEAECSMPSPVSALCFQGSFLLLQHEEHPELLLCAEL